MIKTKGNEPQEYLYTRTVRSESISKESRQQHAGRGTRVAIMQEKYVSYVIRHTSYIRMGVFNSLGYKIPRYNTV